MLHYLQELGSGRFSEYDYGLEKNLQVYGRKTPPDYNLTNIIAPMSVLVGQEDLLAHRQVKYEKSDHVKLFNTHVPIKNVFSFRMR